MKKQSDRDISFEKNSIILFALMMGANICNYLFQIITGRLLSVEDYAIENTILSLYSIFSIPNSIVTMISARYLAKTHDNNEKSAIIRALFLITGELSLFLIVVGLACVDFLNEIFSLNNYWYIVIILFLNLFSLIYATVYGILQGMQEFAKIGILNFLVAFGKLLFSIILILIGWKVYGVLVAMIIGTIVAIIYGSIPIRHDILIAFKSQYANPIQGVEFAKYAIGTIIAQGIVMAYTNGDMLLIKYYFDDTTAGIYSSAMVLGKIAMYISGAIIATSFPMVVVKASQGEDTSAILKKAFLYGGGTSIICSVGMILFAKYVVALLFGEKYIGAIEYLPAVSCFVIPLTFVTILMNYMLALSLKKFFAISMCFAFVCCIVITSFFHQTVWEIMLCAGGSLSIAFMLNIVYLFIHKKRTKVTIS